MSDSPSSPAAHAAPGHPSPGQPEQGPHDPLSKFVRIFLESNLSTILIVFSVLAGAAALFVTPREEDPQIVVPLADVYVRFPGHSAAEVEQLVATPLERVLYQIDGVEYVYSMSREDMAIITVRFYVGEDRERSLVKLYKRLDEYVDIVPPGIAGWVVKPVEIDDVPVVTLALTGDDSHSLRRVGEEAIERLSAITDVSRAYVVGGEPRTVRVELDAERLRGRGLGPSDVARALRGANVSLPSGDFTRLDSAVHVATGPVLAKVSDIASLVVGVFDGRPVLLSEVADLIDGPDEVTSYVRHGWGPARHFAPHHGAPGTVLGEGDAHGSHNSTRRASEAPSPSPQPREVGRLDPADEPGPFADESDSAVPAVTLAIAKKKGTNAVSVAERVLAAADRLRRESLPENVTLVVTRNYGLTADEKVNELIEALAVAILIVIALLTLSLGWREAVIVAVAVPVVFGLTLAVNLLFGYTINRVTLFALILSLGLLVDDPIVDVENIARHYHQRKRATREITLAAVAEIRPPLISATLAVIVSFLPLFFITGMMGPYMAPMALNVPVSMLMSMLVAFTITPWLCYHMLRSHYERGHGESSSAEAAPQEAPHQAAPHQEAPHQEAPHQEALYDPEEIKRTFLYKLFRPLMAPLMASRLRAVGFLLLIALLTAGALGLAATRHVPLKMLPFDNKNELLLVLDFDEGTSLERADAAMREFEERAARIPEVVDYTSYVGLPSPMDFNGLVRHYYLRQGPHLGELRLNFVGKKSRSQQSHGIGLRLRDELTRLAESHGAVLKIVELPPGPPVLASVVAEVRGRPDHRYEDLLAAGETVGARFSRETGMGDVDDMREAPARKLVFEADQEKAALAGVAVADIAEAVRLALAGDSDQVLRVDGERNPLRIVVRLPRAERSSADDLAAVHVRGLSGNLVALAELGRWTETRVDQTIYHKNLERVAYVLAETVDRAPGECIADIVADRRDLAALIEEQPDSLAVGAGRISGDEPRPVEGRTFFHNGAGVLWGLPEGIEVRFGGEGEWKITADVFRDLGIAFGAAVLMIYVILVAQTGSFVIPWIVMLAIPLTVLGVMPGFWVLNLLTADVVGGHTYPVFFTATAMIGMIALAGIVTRDAIILVDFIELSIRQGRGLFDAIMESRVVRMRPILLTAGAALLSSLPITLDPIFSGLGWSLIFGLLASTVFTLFVIPVSYWLVYAGRT